MSAFDIEFKKLKDSKKITDVKELIKLQLVAAFIKATSEMETSEILEVTGLHKADLSRLRAFNLERFSIDRIVGLLDELGHSITVAVKPKKRAS